MPYALILLRSDFSIYHHITSF